MFCILILHAGRRRAAIVQLLVLWVWLDAALQHPHFAQDDIGQSRGSRGVRCQGEADTCAASSVITVAYEAGQQYRL